VPPGSTKISVEINVTTPLYGTPSFFYGGDILTSFCSKGSTQQWNFEPNNAVPQLLVSSKIPDACVTLPQPQYTGASIALSFKWMSTSCNKSDTAQLWNWNTNGQIVNSNNGKCLEATTVNKVIRQGYDWVDLLECTNSPNQKWIPNKNETILNVGTGRCLEAAGPLLQTTAFKTPQGEIVVVVANLSDDNVNFKLKYGIYASLLHSPAHSIQTYIWASTAN